jgi:CarD family transcriptional regulator
MKASKASGRVTAPARTAKAASVAVARVQGEKTAATALKAAVNAESKPAAAAVAKPATKPAPKPAAKEVPSQAAAPKQVAAPKQAAKDVQPPVVKHAQPPAAKEMHKPAAATPAPTTPLPTPGPNSAPTPRPTHPPTNAATTDATPASHANPADKRPTAQAAAAPPAMKMAPAEAPTALAAPRPDQPAEAPQQAAPPPRPAPAPGHIDRRPGPVDRIPPRPPSKAEVFVEGDYVVYPTHGVGKVERIATEEIAGHRLELIHITFEENRMTLRVPVAKARSAGLRKLATRKLFDEAMTVLKGRARIKRTMWSRRAQEYEAKINSGDPLAIAEVVRDLHRNAGQPDQSFSERQIYEAAMDRLAAELAALDKTDKPTAVTKLGDFLKTV